MAMIVLPQHWQCNDSITYCRVIVLMTMQTVHIISSASTPMDRWKSASGPFKSIYSIDSLAIVTLIILVIVACGVSAKYNQSLRRRKKQVVELNNTIETIRQENKELKAVNEKLRQA